MVSQINTKEGVSSQTDPAVCAWGVFEGAQPFNRKCLNSKTGNEFLHGVHQKDSPARLLFAFVPVLFWQSLAGQRQGTHIERPNSYHTKANPLKRWLGGSGYAYELQIVPKENGA